VYNFKVKLLVLSILGAVVASAAHAQQAASLAECRTISDNAQRLVCYDRLPTSNAGSGLAAQPSGARVFGPETLRRLNAITVKFASAYLRTPDEQERSNLRVLRRQAVAETLQSAKDITFEEWPGKIRYISEDADGISLAVVFEGFSIRQFSIKKGTPVYEQLKRSSAAVNDEVVVAAEAKGGDGLDYIVEGSFTPLGSMRDPEYKVVFKSVSIPRS